MKSGHLSIVFAVAALVFVSALPRAQQAPAPGNLPSSQVLPVQGGQIRVVTVATGLVHPWSIAFLPDGRTMLVAEKSGRLRIVRDGTLDPQPVWTAPDAAPAATAGQGRGQGRAQGQGQAGQGQDQGRAQGQGRGQGQGQGQGQGGDTLHSVAVHPQFAQNRFVYISYPKLGERGSTLAVARGRLEGATLTDVREIFVADAWETGGNLAGRIAVWPGPARYM